MWPFLVGRRQKLQQAPVREKLNQILSLGIWCVLLLFFFVITLWQAVQTLQATQAAAKSLAELAAESSAAAVSFDDRVGAQKQLDIFRHIQAVETVEIFTPVTNPKVFAHYPALADGVKDTEPPAMILGAQQLSQLSWNRYAIRLPIVYDGETIGLVVLQTRLDAFWFGILLNLLVAALAMWLAYVVVRQFMGQLIAVIIHPLLDLASVMRRITTVHDYSQRAQRQSQD
jgi:hypothetical protein